MTAAEYPTVAVVIPTMGRDTLRRAVESALAQSVPVTEIIVVLDADVAISVPADRRVRIVRTSFGVGAGTARQFGIDAATSDVIALLDDDDEWHPEKLTEQLRTVRHLRGAHWIAACSVVAQTATTTAVWPRRLIQEQEPVDDFIFRFHSPRFGGATLQTSTLCFPRAVATAVPWSAPPGSQHDDPAWLIRVRTAFPDIPIVQVPRPLVTYHLTDGSLSRTRRDESAAYIAWGRAHLARSSRRTQGDYFLTSPVTSAVAGGSPEGVLRSTIAGFRYGRPGFWAICYAAAAIPRAALRAWAIRTGGGRR